MKNQSLEFRRLGEESGIGRLSLPDWRRMVGFTLIELLVSLGIGMLLVGGGLVAYNRFDDKQKVVAGGRQLTLALRDAQKRAQSGEKPEVGSCEMLDMWRVRKVDVTAYEVAAICDDGGSDDVFDPVVYSLPTGVRFGEEEVNVSFKVITGEVVGATTVVVTDRDGENPYYIEVTGGGAVGDFGSEPPEVVEPPASPEPSPSS